MKKNKIFSDIKAKQLTLFELRSIFMQKRVDKIFYKELSPNDNSKNQVYVGTHIDELKFLPDNELVAEQSSSRKKSKTNVKFTMSLQLQWLTSFGKEIIAPQAKMIYYPQYPEVRFSGFLQGAKFDSDGWFDPAKKGRYSKRILFLGVSGSTVYAWLAVPDSAISKAIDGIQHVQECGVLCQMNSKDGLGGDHSKKLLIGELSRIHAAGWIRGKKRGKDGVCTPYNAPNGGGYTLEAELGIAANGCAEPDFIDWEVKQFAVKSFEKVPKKQITLMTPEPDGGVYVNPGFIKFMHMFGYPDQIIDERLNFNGKHLYDIKNSKTNLKLLLSGYDRENKVINDAKGCIALADQKNQIAASWSFSKMLKHWKNKHARAVYVPAIGEISKEFRQYKFSGDVHLYEGTDFNRFVCALVSRNVFYDPGCKLENINTSPRAKRRNQFRVSSIDLGMLYRNYAKVNVRSEDE